MREPGDMQTVWYTLTLGGRGEEASVSLPVRLDADDEEVYRVVEQRAWPARPRPGARRLADPADV